MVRNRMTIALMLLALFAATTLAPVRALADSQQNNKNLWRNLAIAGAAVAGYGLITHNSTAAAIGAAGSGYSAYRYEQDRHHQSQQQNDWRYYNGNQNYGYYNGNGYGYSNNNSYNNGRRYHRGNRGHHYGNRGCHNGNGNYGGDREDEDDR